MKALFATGRPEALVGFGEAEGPRPRPDEALVRVDAFSVNRGEMFLLEERDPGWRPGKDIAGVAALPLAGLTALRLLRLAGNVTGRRILLTGASGGVGHYVTELAAAAGAEITVVTASAERGRRLAELGAAQVVHDVAAAPGPYHLVLESTGGENLALAADRLAHQGTLIWFGQASLQPSTLSFFALRDGPGSVTLRQFSYWDFPASYGEDLAILVRLVATGRLHPEIGRVADWADTAATIADLSKRRIRGNAVLTVS
jgi:NADPH2:quinone reductase